MPSQSFISILTPLLSDVSDLVGAHQQGRTGKPGRQWNLAGLNRAMIVMAVSAWEAYVEHVVDEAIEALKPAVPPLGPWPALKASVGSARGRFNTPNPENVKTYIRDALGLEDVTDHWAWRNTTSQQARERLSALLRLRHQIAHGLAPRPTVNHGYASKTSTLVRQLAKCTDGAIRDHLSQQLASIVAW